VIIRTIILFLVYHNHRSKVNRQDVKAACSQGFDDLAPAEFA